MGLFGTWYVLPTPFDQDLVVDHHSLAGLVEAAISWKVDGFLAMGIMAEPLSLSDDERSRCLGAIFDVARGTVPVVVGCSAASSTRAGALAIDARSRGAVAAMVSPPTLAPDLDALPRYFAAVQRIAELPLVVQDEPMATGVRMPVSTILACALASSAETIKLEDPPTGPKLSRLLEEGPALSVFGGLGGVNALSELRRGAAGTMTGFAYPEILRRIHQEIQSANVSAAAAIFDRYLPLIAFEGQPVIGLLIRKEILRRRGVIGHGPTRVGRQVLDAATTEELDDLLGRLSIQPGADPLALPV